LSSADMGTSSATAWATVSDWKCTKPRLARTADGALAEGAVVTIEPGIYRPGWGGVRIEGRRLPRFGWPEDPHELFARADRAWVKRPVRLSRGL
jgi:hypothetical protein